MSTWEDKMHLLLDGIVRSGNDELTVRCALQSIPDLIQLQIVHGPDVYRTPNGLVGIVIIAESHIAIHIEGNRFFSDIFTCREFNSNLVVSYLTSLFALEGLRQSCFPRGIEFLDRML